MTKPRIRVVATVLALLVLLSLAVVSIGRATEFRSRITSDDRLLAHGVDLEAVPLFGPAPRVGAAQAQDIAASVTRIATGPDETHHVLARPTAGAALRSSWLLLFAGGKHGGSLGPPEGADARVFTTDYSGVLIDDQTGELLYWFQGGSVSP